jgi:hypothetical protein
MMNSGLVIMSKFSILDVSFSQYKTYNPWSFYYFSEKGFLTGVLRIGS